MYKYKLSYNNKEFTMLDYYGSIKMDKDEINEILIKYFKLQMKQTSIVKMIEKYRRLEFIEPEYSVSGWHMFHGQTVVNHLQDGINKEKLRAYSFLKFIHVMETLGKINRNYNIPHDLYELIHKKYMDSFIFQLLK